MSRENIWRPVYKCVVAICTMSGKWVFDSLMLPLAFNAPVPTDELIMEIARCNYAAVSELDYAKRVVILEKHFDIDGKIPEGLL